MVIAALKGSLKFHSDSDQLLTGSFCFPAGLSPPTAYATFPTPPAILSEAALYQPPLLAAPRPPQATVHSSAHALAYYPPQPHLYMNMNYTAYYPRSVQLQQTGSAAPVFTSIIGVFIFPSLCPLLVNQPPSVALHSWLLRSPTRSHGSSRCSSAAPSCRCGVLGAASARCPGEDAGAALQHGGQRHPRLLPRLSGEALQQPRQGAVRSSLYPF